MTAPSICLILPCYNDLPYAQNCIASFLHNTRNPVVIMIDDGTPGLNIEAWDRTVEWFSMADEIYPNRYDSNSGGPTRGWNDGLVDAQDYDYAVCGNTDTLFTPGWEIGMLGALEKYHLVGPVTNCPGWGSAGLQDVRSYLPDYEASDELEARRTAAERLQALQAGNVVPVADAVVNASPRPGVMVRVPDMLNGFTMMAKTETWWEGAFDKDHVFNPAMAKDGQELELQLRWSLACRRIAIVPSSFVFHYRAISRGDEYLCEGAYRKEGNNNGKTAPEGNVHPACGVDAIL